jgi:hypothetical protein
MNSNKTSKTTIRSGYPLESDNINQTIEHFLYDIAFILSTPMPGLINNNGMDLYFGATGYVNEYSENLNQSQLGIRKIKEIIEKDHTSNWRRV